METMAIGRAGNGKYHRWIKEDKGSILRRYIVGMGERDDLCIKKNWKIDRPLAYCRLEILSRHVLPGKMRKWKCFHRVNWSPAPLDYTTRLESRTRNNFARAKYGKERQKGESVFINTVSSKSVFETRTTDCFPYYFN